jgi:hypothetical protein
VRIHLMPAMLTTNERIPGDRLDSVRPLLHQILDCIKRYYIISARQRQATPPPDTGPRQVMLSSHVELAVIRSGSEVLNRDQDELARSIGIIDVRGRPVQ